MMDKIQIHNTKKNKLDEKSITHVCAWSEDKL